MQQIDQDPSIRENSAPPYRWTMRIIGSILAVSAAFFLSKNYVSNSPAFWLMLLCAGVGVITFGASWLPRSSKSPVYSLQTQEANHGQQR